MIKCHKNTLKYVQCHFGSFLMILVRSILEMCEQHYFWLFFKPINEHSLN